MNPPRVANYHPSTLGLYSLAAHANGRRRSVETHRSRCHCPPNRFRELAGIAVRKSMAKSPAGVAANAANHRKDSPGLPFDLVGNWG